MRRDERNIRRRKRTRCRVTVGGRGRRVKKREGGGKDPVKEGGGERVRRRAGGVPRRMMKIKIERIRRNNQLPNKPVLKLISSI